MSDIKVSVIVPMYNVERYLDQCVKSIQAQTLRDIEIILVDDGSPDRCGEMADQYATEDPRIKVVHRENGGLGPARNSGMEVATGEYIGFVDSDDWIEPEMYEHLYKAAIHYDADACFSGFKAVKQGKTVFAKRNPFADQKLCGQSKIFELRRAFYGALPINLNDDPMPVSVWANIYSRALIESNELRFRNIRSEDKFFNITFCKHASIVTAISDTNYNYRRDGQSSITTSLSDSMVDSYLELFDGLLELARQENMEYRDECILRTKRGITDYVRVAMQVIESSKSSSFEKRKSFSLLIDGKSVRYAIKGYPFQKLPLTQKVFGFALKLGNITILKALAGLRSRI